MEMVGQGPFAGACRESSAQCCRMGLSGALKPSIRVSFYADLKVYAKSPICHDLVRAPLKKLIRGVSTYLLYQPWLHFIHDCFLLGCI